MTQLTAAHLQPSPPAPGTLRGFLQRRGRLWLLCFAVSILLFITVTFGPRSTVLAAALLGAISVVVLWRPELALVAMITMPSYVDRYYGGAQVRLLVGTAVYFFAVGMSGALARRLAGRPGYERQRTALDLPMAAVGAFGVASVLIGLLRGNEPSLVVFSSWHVLSWPLYYLLVTTVANTPERLYVNAVVLATQTAVSLPVTLLSPLQAGGGLGIFASVLIALLLVPRPPAPRWLLATAAAVCLLDVLQCGYRTVWISAGTAVLTVLLVNRRVLLSKTWVLRAVLLGGALLLAGVVGPALLRQTALGQSVSESMERSAGYRAQEAAYGWDAFARSPLFGQGFGYMNRKAWIPGLEEYGAGPTYHVFYITILAGQGIIGMALAVWMLAQGFVGVRPRLLRRYASVAAGATVGVALQGAVLGAVLGAGFASPRISQYPWAVFPTLVQLSAIWLQKSGRTAPQLREEIDG